jgi:organic radical activating enzyme
MRLDLVGKLSQHSVQPAALEVAQGKPLPAPQVVELDPSSFCDLACPECISGPLLQQGRFDSAKLMDLGGELVAMGVRAVILIGGGEPLMHPSVGDLIELLGQGGIAIGITTNGTQVRRYLPQILGHACWVRVSVDASTPEVYGTFRPHRGGRDVFAQVIDGMAAIADGRSEDSALQLGYSFLVMAREHGEGEIETNVDDLAAAARLAKEVGCDYFEVKPEYDLGHNVLQQREEIVGRMVGQIEEARALDDDAFSIISPAHLDCVIAGVKLSQPKEYRRCAVAEMRTLITPTGAYVCPYHRGNEQAAYGQPDSQPFSEMWRGPARQEAMTAIQPSRDCGFNCIRHESNLHIQSLAAQEPGPPDLVPDYDPFI